MRDEERKMLDDLFVEKSRVAYDLKYISTLKSPKKAVLGTIEADAAGKYGRWNSENYRAERFSQLIANHMKSKNLTF